ncbi:Cystine-knot cytokine [Trinorchestia longiramus]|nr:Cystine-knot cytokine [Trinorchestia longiramus]
MCTCDNVALVVLLVLLLVEASQSQGRDDLRTSLQSRQMGVRLQSRGISAREQSAEGDTRLSTVQNVLRHTRDDHQSRISDSNVVPDSRHQLQHRTPHKHTSAVLDSLRHSRRSRLNTPSNDVNSRLESGRRWNFASSSLTNSSHLPHNNAHVVVPNSSRNFRTQESHDSQSQYLSDRRSLSSSSEPYSRIRTRQNYSPYASPYGNSRSASSSVDASELNHRRGRPSLSTSKQVPENRVNSRQPDFLGRNLTDHHRHSHSSSDLLQASREVEFLNNRTDGKEHVVRDDRLSRNIDEIVLSRQNELRDFRTRETPVQRTMNSDRTESSNPQENGSHIQEVERPTLQENRGEEQNNKTSTRKKKSKKKQKKKNNRRNRNRRNRGNKGKKKRRRLQTLITEQNLVLHDVEGESFLDCCPSKLVVIEKQVGKARDNHAVELHPDSQYFYERVCLDQFEGEECIFPSRALKPWVKTRCAPTYSFSQALVRRYASEDDWSLDYVEVSSGCSCQVSLDSVSSRSTNDRSDRSNRSDRSTNSTTTSRH